MTGGANESAPVLLIAGQLLTGALWRPQIEALGAGHRFLIADQVSHQSIAAMAAQALSDAPRTFSIVAHAMGGFVAFEILRRAPGRVTKLALMSTLAAADTPLQTKRREGYARLVREGNFAQVVDERLPILLHPKNRDDPALTQIVRDMAEAVGAEGFLRQQNAVMSRPDSRPSLAAINCPTLILFAREDGIVTLADQQEMAAAIPGACLNIIEECGHLMSLEKPREVNAALAAWL